MTTTTAAVMISDALKELQVIEGNETPDSTMYADGLRMLNRLLDVHSNVRAFEYAESQLTLALTGQTSFDIGPTGADITADRPIKILSAIATLSGLDYDVYVENDITQYDKVVDKAATGAVPEVIFCNATYPDFTVYPYPLCSGTTLKMRAMSQVKQFSTTATEIDMPPGYEDYLMLALAVRMAPSYLVTVTPETMRAYKSAKRAVKRTNTIIPDMKIAVPQNGQIMSGYPAILAG